MTLVTVADCKAYCRVQGTAEDAQFAIWHATALGSVLTYLRRSSLDPHLRTFRIPQGATCHTDTLRLPTYPVSLRTEDSDGYEEIAAPVLTDADAEVIDEADYHLDERIGVFTAVTGVTFARFPYTVVATVGLSVHPDYALIIEPVINGAILDLVADRWARRLAAATSENEGGGVGVDYAEVGLPKRMKDALESWRMVRAL